MNKESIVSKVWSFCDVLRDEESVIQITLNK